MRILVVEHDPALARLLRTRLTKNHFSVEVAGPGGIKTVLVDAQTGKVTATNASSADREDND